MGDIKIIDLDGEPDEDGAPPPPLHFPQITRDFLFGGRAYFRIMNPKNETLLYKIGVRSGRAGTQWSGEQSYFLNVFVSATAGYAYVGVVDPDSGSIVPTGRSKFLKGQREYDAAEWAIKAVLNGSAIAPGYRIFHDGRCGACGHALQSRGDRESGFHLEHDPAARVAELDLGEE